MKKIYLSVLGLMAIGSFSAQVNKPNVAPLVKKQSPLVGAVKKTPAKPVSEEKATVLWSDDFSVQSNWVINSTGTNTAGWEFKVGNYDLLTTPPPFTTLSSTSAANGYLMVNSDKFGGGGAGADTDGNIITSTATTVANLSSTSPYLRLRFESNFRWWHDSRGVRISLDGLNWVEYNLSDVADYNLDDLATVDTLEGHYNGGQSSGDPEVTYINISSVAGNATTVYVQFYYSDNDYWSWYWAVDDVSIEVIEDYDLTFVSPYWGSTGAWGARLPYFNIPVSQIVPIDFSGGVKNNGAQIQNDVTVTTTVGAFTATSAPMAIAQGILDTLDCPGQWTPASTVGSNTVNMSTTSGQTDAFTADNALAPFDINVTNYLYSRDNGVAQNGTYNQGQGFEAGNIYDMYTAATLMGIDVHINGVAVAGAEIYATVYSVDATTGDFIYANGSAPYILNTADLDTVITLPLLTPQSLNAGEPYLVVVGSFGDNGASNDLVIATSGTSAPNTSYYFDMTVTTGGPTGTWFYTTSTPMVRMNFDPSLSVNEVESSSVLSLYPNPAEGSTTVSFDVKGSAEVTLNVTDLSGKVVYTNDLGSVKGAQKVTLNTEVLNNGIYFVNVNMNGSVSTKKLVVKK